jgi:CxxC-x17-CxxC domain-containing protein
MKDYKSKGGFNRGGSSRPSYGNSGPRKFGGHDSDRPREMHKATCSQCHNPCEVPFVPNGKKPVYCSNCFVKDGEDASRRDTYPRKEFAPREAFKRDAAPRDDRGMDELKQQLKAVNDKLDRLVRIVEDASWNSVATAAPEEHDKPAKPARKAAPKKK